MFKPSWVALFCFFDFVPVFFNEPSGDSVVPTERAQVRVLLRKAQPKRDILERSCKHHMRCCFVQVDGPEESEGSREVVWVFNVQMIALSWRHGNSDKEQNF